MGKGDKNNRVKDWSEYRKNYPVKLSIIIAVLDSHEVVQHQIRHFEKFIWRYPVELIIMDDGSEQPLHETVIIENTEQIRIVQTHDKRNWSQPCARNKGAELSRGDYLLMTDIDHVLTEDTIIDCLNFNGDKLVFRRTWGVLTPEGNVSRSKDTLMEYGCQEKELQVISIHENTFCMKKSIFCDMLHGYDDKFCGKYGGDDSDLSRRYGELHYSGKVGRHVVATSIIYVYPNPRADIKKIFHSLRR